MIPTVEIALALILRGEEVLVARRARGPLAGKWEFPGGKIESGEMCEAAAVRECCEELGAEVCAGKCIGVVEHAYPDVSVRLHLVTCVLEAGAVPRPLESEALAWAPLAELDGWDIPEPNHGILRTLRDHLGTETE